MTNEEAELLYQQISDEPYNPEQKSSIVDGFLIFRKYDPTADIEGANHDIVYGPNFSEEMTEEDLKVLFRLGWMFEDEHFSHFA